MIAGGFRGLLISFVELDHSDLFEGSPLDMCDEF
jgi:hypothetical protein